MSLSKLSAQFQPYVANVYEWLSSNKSTVVAVAVPTTIATLGWIHYRANKDLPPGPRFFVFSSFFTPKTPEDGELNCVKLRKDYGDFVSGRIGSTVIILLNSYDAIKEAYVAHGDKISGRPQTSAKLRIDEGKGILNADGEIWQEHRRFVLSSLRDFGFGKVGSESIIREELESLSAFLTEAGENGTKGLDPRLPLSKTSTNVICSLVFGQRCGTEDEFERITEMLRDLQQNRINKLPMVILLILGVLLRIPGDPLRLKRLFSNVDKMLDYVNAKVDEHRSRHAIGREADLIDSYLTTQAELELKTPGKHTFTNPQLSRVIFELFLAGTDTTATMLRWSLFLMAVYPEIQDKVHQEIAEALEGQVPKVTDRSILKYTDATLHEIHRYAVMLPLGGPLHRVTSEVYVRGYRFPKEAIVMVNLLAVFRDPSLWSHPRDFNPENFLDKTTKSLINTDFLIPFLIGRRACPGESLARQELFMLFTGLMQRFTVKFDPQGKPYTMKDVVFTSFNRIPPDFKMIFVPRK